jgi:hypothetical protein
MKIMKCKECKFAKKIIRDYMDCDPVNGCEVVIFVVCTNKENDGHYLHLLTQDHQGGSECTERREKCQK